MTKEAPAQVEIDDNMPPIEEVVEEVELKPEAESETAPDTDSVEEPAEDKVQKRINKITADKYTEKRRADAAEKALSEFKANNKAPEQAEPTLEQFDFDEGKYHAALATFHAQKATKDAISTYKTEQDTAANVQRQSEISQNFNARVDEFRKTALDYDQVIQGLPELPQDTLDAIMQSDKGPQIAHYLGKHLDIADVIATASPMVAAMKLGEISAQLSNNKPTKQPSAAPDPIKPVKPGGKLNKNLEDMSMAEIYENED